VHFWRSNEVDTSEEYLNLFTETVATAKVCTHTCRLDSCEFVIAINAQDQYRPTGLSALSRLWCSPALYGNSQP
jgi:hypothetical protein